MIETPVLDIRIESPDSDDVRALLSASSTTEPDQTEDLFSPNTEFIVARLDGRAVGCIALVDQLKYAEVKRLYVDETARGNGIGAALVVALENAARDIGLRQVRLAPPGPRDYGQAIVKKLGYVEMQRLATADRAPVWQKTL